jgi:hypothetical protein
MPAGVADPAVPPRKPSEIATRQCHSERASYAGGMFSSVGLDYRRSIFCWRVTNKLTKDPVKVRKRLKTYLVGYLSDAQVLVVQQDFSLLNADAAQVLHER